ncbi:response regulator [Myroides marinus]|uniref:response regulator n=1 Tax=Myroides marinus TaxID=703342 RepID=UPI002578E589|nr:response regulator [Myroides marinus]MDM1347545.1 response regulator [Myroides marinus]MDM1350803.1 response regulator [Myroides marinus]MDM1355274.1 response regulator [Myroides marinus]MDM1358010.1 response regulator [Myroides marinus]MDM1363244.1 response regulator [Myroides marinus]
MKYHSILIIDDEELGANNLKKFLESNRTDADVLVACTEEEIIRNVDNSYYDLAIVDLRMDNFSINGFDIIKRIFKVNSFAKVLIMSAYVSEFEEDLNDILSTGRIAGIFPKEDFEVFSTKINKGVTQVFKDFDTKHQGFNTTELKVNYKNLKNSNTLESFKINCNRFVGFLFYSMGFNSIKQNDVEVKDYNMSFLVRNEIADNFFNKFKPFIAVEYIDSITEESLNNSSLQHTADLFKLIFWITTKDVDIEVFNAKFSNVKKDTLSVLISSKEIERIIQSDQIVKTVKQIIEDQFEKTCRSN